MSSEPFKAKILVIGPCKVGKSLISNYIAGIGKTLSEEYHPTVGVRILEFERDINDTGKLSYQGGNQKIEVELWDCSGDRKYEACWPAFLQGIKGVLLVFNPESKNQERELENWYSRFAGNIKESTCLIFAHNSSGSATSAATKLKMKLSKTMSRVAVVNTSLDFDADTIKFEFDNLLVNVVKDAEEKRDSEELNIINNS